MRLDRIQLRHDARARGAVRYTDGEPCARGHVAERYSNNGKCVPCQSIDQTHRHHRKLGLIPTRPQPATCENCNQLPGAKGLALDHDHETGTFRGWLCTPCNTAIGALGDTVEALERATDYLRRNT